MFNILVVHPSRSFDAERLGSNAIVFTNFWSDDEDEWYTIKCGSEKDRDTLLETLKAKTPLMQAYLFGHKDGRNGVPADYKRITG